MNYFSISDFNISGEPIPEMVADKILRFHIEPLNMVSMNLPFEIIISQNSGYRSVKWEKSKGRLGNSQHCFKGNGAVDLTCKDFDNDFNSLLDALIHYTDYTRFAIYDNFIHCDYAFTPGNRWVFNKKWERMYQI